MQSLSASTAQENPYLVRVQMTSSIGLPARLIEPRCQKIIMQISQFIGQGAANFYLYEMDKIVQEVLIPNFMSMTFLFLSFAALYFVCTHGPIAGYTAFGVRDLPDHKQSAT